MQWGASWQTICDIAKARGDPEPPFMAERAEVQPWMARFWAAWFDLSTCRPPGMAGVPPIPWTAVDAYARRYRMDDDDFETLMIVVRGLDAELVAYAEEKSRAEGAT